MKILLVVDDPADWPLEVPGVETVAARAYLTDPSFGRSRGARVFNLSRSYRYQTSGWYVSLLATARGHRPVPDVGRILDMRSRPVLRITSSDFDDLIQRSLAPLKGKRFELSVYFGCNMAKRYAALARRLYNQFQVPLLRATFERKRDRWQLLSVSPIAGGDVPDSHRPFLATVAAEHFARGRFSPRLTRRPAWDLAILWDETEKETTPSDPRAIARFRRAAASLGIAAQVVGREDYGALGEFDALFIRETTAVNHHTYRFARRAEAEGLVVMDDPQSILTCGNKVFLAELLARHEIPHPRTLLVHQDNVDEIVPTIGLPCVLKQPDSAFSQGVVKVESEEELRRVTASLLEQSDLLVAQEFLPTEYDWRVGVVDRQPLFVCQYHMARRHWQIIRWEDGKQDSYGKVTTFAVEDAPAFVVRTALKAANLIGDGLYGVDVKSKGRRAYVIEVNDNPNIEAGVEDKALGVDLYRRIMEVFLRRMEERKAARHPVEATTR
jgi:glutathione synthase/RimK-type ligase-like ATP-grasp enzyme